MAKQQVRGARANKPNDSDGVINNPNLYRNKYREDVYKDDEEWTKEKSNKIVLIGKNLDHQTIKNQLSSCRFNSD